MLLLLRRLRIVAQARRFITTEEINRYKTDTQSLASWLDIGGIKNHGKIYVAESSLTKKKDSYAFPTVKGFNLNGRNVVVPSSFDGKAKLIAFSFKHYGFSLVRSWLDPFFEKHKATANLQIIELCFIEYGFLSIAKTVFVNNMKSTIDQSQHDKTAVIFGGVLDFAASLLLPNKYTGYVYLLDKDNKVRWKGCGKAEASELEALFKCTEILLSEK